MVHTYVPKTFSGKRSGNVEQDMVPYTSSARCTRKGGEGQERPPDGAAQVAQKVDYAYEWPVPAPGHQ